MSEDMHPDAPDAIALSQRIRPLLGGHHPGIQGGALADLVSVFIAGHHPAHREQALELFIAAVRSLTPISEQEIFPDGLPEWWKAQ
jgi:hypothetical protein